MYLQKKENGNHISISETCAAAEAGSVSGDRAPKLYRSAKDLGHWFVYLDDTGWLSFPAKTNGWTERLPVQGLHGLDLRPVPLWLSFRTGLLEAAVTKALPNTA